MEFYCATEHFGARFFRVGIWIDKQKPPRRGIKLRFPSNQSCYVVFKDEHLPSTFYYTCGKVGPYLKDCDLASDDEDEPYRDCKYGEWIRWSPMKRNSFFVSKVSMSHPNNPRKNARMKIYVVRNPRKSFYLVFLSLFINCFYLTCFVFIIMIHFIFFLIAWYFKKIVWFILNFFSFIFYMN